MGVLRKTWACWSDILTFGWLERLGERSPRRGMSIAGALISLALGLLSWHYMDTRFTMWHKVPNGYEPAEPTGRIVMGCLVAVAAVTVAGLTFYCAKDDRRHLPSTDCPPHGKRRTRSHARHRRKS